MLGHGPAPWDRHFRRHRGCRLDIPPPSGAADPASVSPNHLPSPHEPAAWQGVRALASKKVRFSPGDLETTCVSRDRNSRTTQLRRRTALKDADIAGTYRSPCKSFTQSSTRRGSSRSSRPSRVALLSPSLHYRPMYTIFCLTHIWPSYCYIH
jgi:hypothetical protein